MDEQKNNSKFLILGFHGIRTDGQVNLICQFPYTRRKKNQMSNHKQNSTPESRIRFFLVLACSALIIFLQNSVYGDESVSDLSLYYSLGGFRASPQPATLNTSLETLSTGVKLSGTICGNFDPATDIGDMLSNQLTNSLASLSSIPMAITSALPGYILCRAKPGMCQLLQHYVVRAEQQWNFAVESCEETVENLGDDNLPVQDWIQLSKAQKWQKESTKGISATEAKKNANSTDGCVTWVGGKSAGCKGKQPIWPTQDAVNAGWCLLQNQTGDCESASEYDNNALNLQKTWASPSQASSWVTDVVGDHKIHVGEESATIAGTGLLPKVDEKASEIESRLSSIVYSASSPSSKELEGLSASHIFITPEIISALRDLPDRDYLIKRMANELALAHTVKKAFLARRLLISGKMEPNIQSAGVSNSTLQEKINLLEQEIEHATFEMQINRRIVADTTISILNAHQARKTPTPPAHRQHEFYLQ